jgi:hypothetical protein
MRADRRISSDQRFEQMFNRLDIGLNRFAFPVDISINVDIIKV